MEYKKIIRRLLKIHLAGYENYLLCYILNRKLANMLFASFRRFIWNFFRLENEHLNNCGQFRAVRDISISPMQTTDVNAIEKMMDDEDGIINRQSTAMQQKTHHHHNTNLTITKR